MLHHLYCRQAVWVTILSNLCLKYTTEAWKHGNCWWMDLTCLALSYTSPCLPLCLLHVTCKIVWNTNTKFPGNIQDLRWWSSTWRMCCSSIRLQIVGTFKMFRMVHCLCCKSLKMVTLWQLLPTKLGPCYVACALSTVYWAHSTGFFIVHCFMFGFEGWNWFNKSKSP